MSANIKQYYRYSRKLWSLALLSLPLDLIFILFIPAKPLIGEAELFIADAITLAAAVLVLIFSRLDTATLFHQLRVIRDQQKLIYIGAAILFGVGIVGIAHLFVPILANTMKGQGFTMAIVISVFIALGIFGSVKEQFKLVRTRMQNRVLTTRSIEQAHREILFFSLLPVILARTISLSGVLRVILTSGSSVTLICYVLTAGLLLLAAEPRKAQFIGACRYCLSAVSVSITHLGVCPQCAERLKKQGKAYSSATRS